MRKSLLMDWRYCLYLCGIAAGSEISVFLINDLFPHPSASHPNQNDCNLMYKPFPFL